jgi:hypothetical protein
MEVGAMEEKEKRLRTIVMADNIRDLLSRQQIVRNVSVNGEVLERLSLALKVGVRGTIQE